MLVASSNRCRSRLGSWLAPLCTTSLLLASTPAAAGEVFPNVQSQAANASWLAYMPAPAAPTAICIADTGVSSIARDLDGQVLARYALDGGSGEDLDTSGQHGTYMALAAGAKKDGYGMVGAWPAVKIVSIRLSDPGTTVFPFERYVPAAARCRQARVLDGYPIVAASLSLGGYEVPPAAALTVLEESVAYGWQTQGIATFAAAGNSRSGPVLYPARAAGVVGVGAGAADNSGLCSFASRGEGLDVMAPGCGLSMADPLSGEPRLGEGSSQATAEIAAYYAALRAYAPALSADRALDLLVTSAPGRNVDVEAAFRAAGLGTQVDQAKAALQSVVGTPPGQQPTGGPGGTSGPPTGGSDDLNPVLEKPRFRYRLAGRRLTVWLIDRPAGATAVARIYDSRERRLRTVNFGKRTSLLVTMARRPRGLVVEYEQQLSWAVSSARLCARDCTITEKRFAQRGMDYPRFP